MNEKLKELKQIITFCKKNGVNRFKSGDIEVELTPSTSKRHKPAITDTTESETTSLGWDNLTPEERLLWSSTPPGVS